MPTNLLSLGATTALESVLETFCEYPEKQLSEWSIRTEKDAAEECSRRRSLADPTRWDKLWTGRFRCRFPPTFSRCDRGKKERRATPKVIP